MSGEFAQWKADALAHYVALAALPVPGAAGTALGLAAAAEAAAGPALAGLAERVRTEIAKSNPAPQRATTTTQRRT